MAKPKIKTDKIEVYLTQEQKIRIEALTRLSGNSSMSEYVLSSVFSPSFGNEKADFYRNINRFMEEQQKMMYIIARVALFIGGEQTSPDEVMKFFKQCQNDAEAKYGENA